MAMNEHDINLVAAAKAGNGKAFEDLYAVYYNKIFALARMTVKNDANAEDILQDAFICAWKNMHTLTNPAAFSTWLQKITLNECYSLLRKKNIAILMDAESEIEDYADEPSDEFLPAVYAERDDLRERLGKIIDGLSEVQKQTIVLYYFNEQKVEEIAYIMECNAGTVKKRLFLARKAIRAEVEEEERKSGEKFYGIAGIPMLALGELLKSQIEAQLIAAEVYTTALVAITEAISGSIASGAAGAGGVAGGAAGSAASGAASASNAASGAAGVATTTAATAAGLTTAAKGMIFTVIIVCGLGLGMGGTLLVDSVLSNSDTPPIATPDSETVCTDEQTPTPVPTQTPVSTQTPVPTTTPTPTPTITSDAWKQLYIDVINEHRDSIYFGNHQLQTLLYINDDDIPEMILCSNSQAGGGYLFTASDNGVDYMFIKPHSFFYLERGNRIYFSEDLYRGVYSGHYTVYEIQDGKFTLLHQGSRGLINNTEPPPQDNDGNWLWDWYIWDDIEVSREEFERELAYAFDTSRTVHPASTNAIHGNFTPDELIEIILNWS
jgi:RNA polymerase sigma factor (sigma-70 family)